MKTRTLPGTDLTVSEACLGTMTWGEQNSEADAHAQLDRAVARGVNFIDTAEMYPVPPTAATQGRTERILGSWIARHGRDGLVVATKMAGPGRREWIRNGRGDITRDTIAEAVSTSLERLKLDVIDLYQIHWPQRNVPQFGATEFDPSKERAGPSIEEQVRGMADMIEAGRIRYWGLSNETAWGVAAFSRAARELGVPGPVTVQNTCSLVSRAVEGDLAESVFREGIAVLPYSPLAGGILTGKYRGGAKPERSRYTLFDTVGARYRKPLVFEACEAYLGVAERHGLTPVQLALGWLRTRWYVGAIILGATSVAQLDENLDAFAVELDAATLADVAAVQLRYPNPAGY